MHSHRGISRQGGGGKLGTEAKNADFIEKAGRFFLFRAVVYMLPVFYATRLILMVVTPQAYHMPGWRMVSWQGARDCSVVLMLFYWQRYAANYQARRSSLCLRRRDAWGLPLVTGLYLSLELPSLLDLPWALAVSVSAVMGICIYLWEMRIVKNLQNR
jgi:hypothetical protein